MKIQRANRNDLNNWVRLRLALWPGYDQKELLTEAQKILSSKSEVCFLARDDQNIPIAFLEGAVHSGPDGPYGHVEGWYVVPGYRKQGIGRKLMSKFELWCLHRTICLLTSDTDTDYPVSPQAHLGCGFRQIAELKIFVKEIDTEALTNTPENK